jgi:hypothetical protein
MYNYNYICFSWHCGASLLINSHDPMVIAEELQYAWPEALGGPSLWSLWTLMGPWEFGRRESVKLERMTGTSGSAA